MKLTIFQFLLIGINVWNVWTYQNYSINITKWNFEGTFRGLSILSRMGGVRPTLGLVLGPEQPDGLEVAWTHSGGIPFHANSGMFWPIPPKRNRLDNYASCTPSLSFTSAWAISAVGASILSHITYLNSKEEQFEIKKHNTSSTFISTLEIGSKIIVPITPKNKNKKNFSQNGKWTHNVYASPSNFT